jgi:Flp pilus assembly protein CpaB
MIRLSLNASIFLAIVLFATPARLGADESMLAKGTRALALKFPKNQPIPGGTIPGAAIDVVAEVSDPIKTGVALLNVKVTAIEVTANGDQTVTLQVTPTQAAVLAIMQKDGAKLTLKLCEKEKPKK